MTNRYIILVDGCTTDEQNAITTYLKSEGYGWWHRFSHAWLVTDTKNHFQSGNVRDKINELAPRKLTLVMAFDDPTHWSGFGQEDYFNWFEGKTWLGSDS